MAARSMAPVEMWGIPNLVDSTRACVPFPDPGGPSRITAVGVGFIDVSWIPSSTVRRSRGPASRPGISLRGNRTAPSHPSFFQETLVMPHDQLGLYLLNRVHRHTHYNE